MASIIPALLKRIELHEDNLLYVMDADQLVSKDTTDAGVFPRADSRRRSAGGRILRLVRDQSARLPLGQSSKKEILMSSLRGRMIGRSLGCELAACGRSCSSMTAIVLSNLDGGTSAVLWYDGQYCT